MKVLNANQQFLKIPTTLCKGLSTIKPDYLMLVLGTSSFFTYTCITWTFSMQAGCGVARSSCPFPLEFIRHTETELAVSFLLVLLFIQGNYHWSSISSLCTQTFDLPGASAGHVQNLKKVKGQSTQVSFALKLASIIKIIDKTWVRHSKTLL